MENRISWTLRSMWVATTVYKRLRHIRYKTCQDKNIVSYHLTNALVAYRCRMSIYCWMTSSPHASLIVYHALLLQQINVLIKVRLHTAINRADFVSWCMLYTYEGNKMHSWEKFRCTFVSEPLNHIHQDTKSVRLLAVSKRSLSWLFLFLESDEENERKRKKRKRVKNFSDSEEEGNTFAVVNMVLASQPSFGRPL